MISVLKKTGATLKHFRRNCVREAGALGPTPFLNQAARIGLIGNAEIQILILLQAIVLDFPAGHWAIT